MEVVMVWGILNCAIRGDQLVAFRGNQLVAFLKKEKKLIPRKDMGEAERANRPGLSISEVPYSFWEKYGIAILTDIAMIGTLISLAFLLKHYANLSSQDYILIMSGSSAAAFLLSKAGDRINLEFMADKFMKLLHKSDDDSRRL